MSYSTKIKEQTRELDTDSSKQCFELADKEAGKRLQNHKKASYQVFKKLDRMPFIMERFTGVSP